LFFGPERGKRGPAPESEARIKQAKAICRECLDREPCFVWGMIHHERYGIWGGYTERERNKLRRETPWLRAR
jgi:WhiB family transcriptional regulator, redox-sensing transcriptional regulator